MTAPWVWQKSTGCSADGSAQMLLERTIICEACYTRVCIDGGMHIDGGWWRFEAEDAKLKDAEDDPLKHSEPGESAGVSVDNHIDGNLDELSWLLWDASQEWREGVNASLELKQFEWREVVNASLESFEEEEAKRAAREAKFKAQEDSDLISAAGASLYEGKRDKIEQAATSAHSATQFAVTRTRIDRVNGDEEAERRKEAKKEEERIQAQRDLVEQRVKAANRVRSAVMALIDAKRAQSEDGKGKGKGRSKPWWTRLSTRELEVVSTEELLERAREAGVDEVELQLALQACGPCSW